MKKILLIIIILLSTTIVFAEETPALPDLLNQLVKATTSRDRALMEKLYTRISSDLKMLELVKKYFPKHYTLYQMVGTSIKAQESYLGYSEIYREFYEIDKGAPLVSQTGNTTNADLQPNKVTISNSKTVLNSANQDRNSNSDIGRGSLNQNRISNQDYIRNRLRR